MSNPRLFPKGTSFINTLSKADLIDKHKLYNIDFDSDWTLDNLRASFREWLVQWRFENGVEEVEEGKERTGIPIPPQQDGGTKQDGGIITETESNGMGAVTALPLTAEQLSLIVAGAVAQTMAAVAVQSNPNQGSNNRRDIEYLSKELKNWEIKFTGESNSSVDKFLEQAFAFKSSKRVSDGLMLDLVPNMLRDKALRWFIVNNSSINSWSKFVSEVRNAYRVKGYDLKLKREMFFRKQHKVETIDEFVTVMRSMNNRITRKLDDEELVDLIKSNLNPYLSTKLGSGNLYSFEELLDWGRNEEANKAQADSNQVQSVASSLDAEFSFVVPVKPESSNNNNNNNKQSSYSNKGYNSFNNNRKFENKNSESTNNTEVKVVAETNITKDNSKNKNSDMNCWNCGGVGHRFTQCVKEKVIFCHCCGKKGVTSRRCTCQRQGNAGGAGR